MSPKHMVLAAIGLLYFAAAPLAAAQRSPSPPSTAGAGSLEPPPPPEQPLRIERDIKYARVGGRALRLDLYLRDTKPKAPLPVVLWVHGDRSLYGDKSPTPAARLVAAGYAVASVEYRLPGEAPFPAQLYDLKAAVRWLRANAGQYNLDGDHIGAWGSSAGGHLVSLLGVTGGVKPLEGDEGNLQQSSRVQAVVDFYGPIDLKRMDVLATKPTSQAVDRPEPVLLGAPVSRDAGIVRTADPLAFAGAGEPPFLIVQGTDDKTVSPRQGEFLQIALNHAGVKNELEYVVGAGHDINRVETPEVAERVTAFFDRSLRGGRHQRDDVTKISEPSDSWVDVFPGQMEGTQNKFYPTPTRGPSAFASYRLYLPPGYDQPANAQHRYPVIYYLHGLNGDSRSGVTSSYIARLDAAVQAGLMPPAIVVLVQGLNQSWYVDSPDGRYPMESVIIKDLIPYIDKTYRTISTREGRAIEGHSMGGAGALHLGFKYPDLFGSVSSISPALIPLEAMRSGLNLEMMHTMFGGDPARYDAEGGWSEAVKNAARIRSRTRVRLICGDKDPLLSRVRWMSDILDNEKIPHRFVLSKGAPHALKEVLAHLDDNPFAYYGAVFSNFR